MLEVLFGLFLNGTCENWSSAPSAAIRVTYSGCNCVVDFMLAQAGIQSGVAIVREILDSGPGVYPPG